MSYPRPGQDRLESYQRSALSKNQLARGTEIALPAATVSTDLRTPPARIRFKESRQELTADELMADS